MDKTKKDYISYLNELFDDANIDELKNKLNFHQYKMYLYEASEENDLFEYHKDCYEVCKFLVNLYCQECDAEMETVLYLDGTTANISAETSTSLMWYDKSIGKYRMTLGDKEFKFCNNIWMEF